MKCRVETEVSRGDGELLGDGEGTLEMESAVNYSLQTPRYLE